jgi:hypothetical protein
MDEDQINYEDLTESQQYNSADEFQYDDYPDMEIEYTTDYY